MKNNEFWYEVERKILEVETTIEKEMWKAVKESTSAMDSKEEQLDVVSYSGRLSEACKLLRKARGFLR